MATPSKAICMKPATEAQWSGNLKKSKDTLTTQSGVMDGTNYTFTTRFEEGVKDTYAYSTCK